MKITQLTRFTLVLAALLFAAQVRAELRAGYGQADITPAAGVPSAGYGDRMGKVMQGTHDPLLTTAFVISNGTKRIAFCGVDHLGMLYGMHQEAMAQVHAVAGLEDIEIYSGSSHTHGGGGAFLDVPGIGFILAGKFSKEVRQSYIDGTAKAIIEAAQHMEPVKIGLGYGRAELNNFRSTWPLHVETCKEVFVMKIEKADGTPFGVLFNYPAHPTVVSGRNMLFTADWVGYARTNIGTAIGGGVKAVYFQGAQADISPAPPKGATGDDFAHADAMGKAMAAEVARVWKATTTSDNLLIDSLKEAYAIEPQANSTGQKVQMPMAKTELNIIVFDNKNAIITIPGELSTILEAQIRNMGKMLGFEHVSIFGLTNDAHGYILTPEAWRHMTYESTVSFGGEMYGELVKNKAQALLDLMVPSGPIPANKRIPASVLQSAKLD